MSLTNSQSRSALPTVMVCIKHYWPGVRAGGPVQTLLNLTSRLHSRINFLVFTTNSDLGSETEYQGIAPDCWSQTENAQVFYAKRATLNITKVQRVLKHNRYDVLYLNSFFEPYFGLLPLWLRRLNLIPRRHLVIAARGQFAPSALSIKPLRKRACLWLTKLSGALKDVRWQASSQAEAEQITRAVGTQAEIIVAPNLARPQPSRISSGTAPREPGTLRVVAIGRISRMKNVTGMLEILRRVNSRINFTFFGPREDLAYWEECSQLLKVLPANITAAFETEIPSARVPEVLQRAELLLQPSLGENFGQSIIEALMEGVPVLTSDRTPWNALESAGAGWSLPLENLDAFARVIDQVAAMSADQHAALRRNAFAYGGAIAADPALTEKNYELLARVAA
ncbi:MAG: glycosyltransferase family 4 protein [Oligoflexia bacterium]|nr:glycosyltransferase family 4 protein [Oligoflexia bacterium]